MDSEAPLNPLERMRENNAKISQQITDLYKMEAERELKHGTAGLNVKISDLIDILKSAIDASDKVALANKNLQEEVKDLTQKSKRLNLIITILTVVILLISGVGAAASVYQAYYSKLSYLFSVEQAKLHR
jgi:hypothetical protein